MPSVKDEPHDQDKKKLSATIAYRDDGRGHGAVWDHQGIARGLKLQTYVAHDGKMAVGDFEGVLGVSPTLAYKPIILAPNDYGQGLLVLAGESRKTALKRPEALTRRKDYEKAMVKDALLRGRPILAICGGGYHLQEFIDGKLKPLEGHDYGASHPQQDLRLNKKGDVIFNQPVHTVSIKEDSLLATMLKPSDAKKFPVNSIHLLAVDDSGKDRLETKASLVSDQAVFLQYISARASENVCGESMDLGTPEGFELYYSAHNKISYAAPVIATQWHIEAYEQGSSRHIIKHMVDAGRTFDQKQKVLVELLEKQTSKTGFLFNKIGFFKKAERQLEDETKSASLVHNI